MKCHDKLKAKIYSLGSAADLTYPYTHLGSNAQILEEIRSGSHPICEKIKAAKLPLMIVGRDALTRNDSEQIVKATKDIANSLGFVNVENGWNGYNVLNRSQGEINAMDLGIKFRPMKNEPKIIFLLGCDNYITPKDIPKNSFVIYVGCLGDQGAQYADVILPAATFHEKSGTYGNYWIILVNVEGRVQFA